MLRVVFMGTPDFAVPALEAISKNHAIIAAYAQPDRPVGRGLEFRPCAVKRKALELGIQVIQPEKLSAPGEFERLSALNPDVIVVVAFGQILRKNVLSLPRLGCLNIHSSLLPRWRGAAPIQRAILAGDPESGVTTMRLVEKLDAGEILLQSRTPIRADDTAGTLHDRLAAMGAELITETLAALANGTLQGRPQDESLVTYAEKLTKDMEWLDPKDPAEVLDRRIRALNPWPGTSLQIKLSGDQTARLKVKQAHPRPDIQGHAGQLYEKTGMLLLGTAAGALELVALQWEGKKEVTASGFLNGLQGRGLKLPLEISAP